MFDIGRLEDLDNLFSLTIRGLESHFENDVPDEDYVIGSLTALLEHLHSIINDYNNDIEMKRTVTQNGIPEEFLLEAYEVNKLADSYHADKDLFGLITATYEKGFKRGRISTY